MGKNEHKQQISELDPLGLQILELSGIDCKMAVITVFRK